MAAGARRNSRIAYFGALYGMGRSRILELMGRTPEPVRETATDVINRQLRSLNESSVRRGRIGGSSSLAIGDITPIPQLPALHRQQPIHQMDYTGIETRVLSSTAWNPVNEHGLLARARDHVNRRIDAQVLEGLLDAWGDELDAAPKVEPAPVVMEGRIYSIRRWRCKHGHKK